MLLSFEDISRLYFYDFVPIQEVNVSLVKPSEKSSKSFTDYWDLFFLEVEEEWDENSRGSSSYLLYSGGLV